MIEIAKDALEFAVRAGNPSEEPEITARRARAFYEFLRAPVGACVGAQGPADPNNYGKLYSAPAAQAAGVLSDKYPHSIT